MQEVRGTVCVQLELELVCIAVVLVYSEEWQRNGGMRGVEWIIGPIWCVNDAMDESKH